MSDASKPTVRPLNGTKLRVRIGIGFLLIVGAILVGVRNSMDSEPVYGGKRLGQWLVEVDYGQPESIRATARRAIQQIGTNALPWIIKDFQAPSSIWNYRLNLVLKKIPFVTFRFPTADQRLRRATWGIDALGSAAEPAIPELLAFLDSCPGYVPSALAGIGPDAIPALQNCLTNTQSKYGQYIPGNTMGAIHNAVSQGKIQVSAAGVFIPEVRMWTQSTNTHAAGYATSLLRVLEDGAERRGLP